MAGSTVTDSPVNGFPMKFTWNEAWVTLFDKQIELIRLDIDRARDEGNLVAYLSCPISSRGGGIKETNVDISEHAAQAVAVKWGHRLWVLNPSQYQMESKVGMTLIERYAKEQGIDMSSLPAVTGGDYMRMWTKALVEDDDRNLGSRFDIFYFLGPSDVWAFFERSGAKTITASVEDYFSRKVSLNSEFRKFFMPPFKGKDGRNLKGILEQDEWNRRRREFFRFYAARGGANYSKGCHDEWNILTLINDERIKLLGLGSQIAGYFDGHQIAPGAVENGISKGYEV